MAKLNNTIQGKNHMNELELYKRLAMEKATKWLQVKIPPVLDEILSMQENKSEYVKNLIIADWERQTAVKDEGQ